jgi:hypothetical protein
MRSRRDRLKHCALLLALLSVCYRGLIPAGFMPATLSGGGDGSWLVLCSGGGLKSPAPHAPDLPAGHAYDECAFALAATPAPPAPRFAATLKLRRFVPGPEADAPSFVAAALSLPPPARAPPIIVV